MDEDTDIFADAPEPATTSASAEHPPASDAPQPLHLEPGLDQLSLTSSPVATETPANTHRPSQDQLSGDEQAPARDPAEGGGFWADLQAGETPGMSSSSSIAGVEAGAAPLASSSMAAAKHPFAQGSEASQAGGQASTESGRAGGEGAPGSAGPEPMQLDPPAAKGHAGIHINIIVTAPSSMLV